MNEPDLSYHGDEIAIIGLSARFPKARNVDEFWNNLRTGVESVTFFSDEEILSSDIDSALLRDPNYVKAGAVLEDIEMFDASFFGYSPREAEIIDPQQRLFLECAWEALEHAGYDPERYPDRIGVYASGSISTYLMNLYTHPRLIESAGDFHVVMGNEKDFLPTRVSYKLNLKGPSISIQTACSSSLVAVHVAGQALLAGECEMALAGGVSIGTPQVAGYMFQKDGIESPDGHCRAFDARGQGFVRGNGLGIVVLKRLEDALADGDHIHAVIKGSAVNNDGSVKVGFTAPSVDGQAQVISMAIAIGRIEPETIGYIEAHGTGTQLGDPVEIAALTKAFRAGTTKERFCAVGSVKTNIGHLDSAAGIAGLIKAVLALTRKEIPPSLHFERPNPKIDFASSPFYVNTELRSWQAGRTPLRAGVSSLGIGGTNAHVILEEAPRPKSSGPSRPYHLLLQSARTASGLEKATAHLREHLNREESASLADIAYTLQMGRRPFGHRRAALCRDRQEAAAALESLDPRRVFTSGGESKNRPVVFMFPGAGAQHVNMGVDLYRSERVFRDSVDMCAQLLGAILGYDLRDLLYPREDAAGQVAARLRQTSVAMPALFVTEFALARLWMSWGVYPEAVIGHSFGEYVAACLAGVFSLEDALQLVSERGRLMQKLPAGAMLALPMAPHEVEPLLGGRLSLAAINGPSLCSVSGPADAIEELALALTEKGEEFHRLHIDVAAHSSMVEQVRDEFTSFIGRLNLCEPSIAYLSNVTGTWVTPGEVTDPGYWARHLCQTVRFSDGARELLKEGDRVFLEVGPGRTLSTLIRQHPGTMETEVLTSMRHPEDQQSDSVSLLSALGRLWVAGVGVDWAAFYADERRVRVPLPTYPFEPKRFWVEARPRAERRAGNSAAGERRKDITDWFYVPSWKRSVSPAAAKASDPAGRKLCWVVFTDSCGLGASLAERLGGEGQNLIYVTRGNGYAENGRDRYQIDPHEPNDYRLLFAELRALGKVVDTIVHLWAVTGSASPQMTDDVAREMQCLYFNSLIYLVQALEERDVEHPLRIEVVSNDMHEVGGEQNLIPEKALVLGPCKVITQEYPNITCRSIDLTIDESRPLEIEKAAGHLLAELHARLPGPVIAYRGNHRWVRIFEPLRLDREEGPNARLRAGGVYLILGGMGGMGLELARFLAGAVRARLVLVGRSPFPGRDEWDGWLSAHGEGDEVSARIRKLQAIERLGAKILVLSSDVTSAERMAEVVSKTREHFGDINGVIQAAGIAEGGIIELETSEKIERLLSAKVRGTRVLESALGEAKLDFMVLCSAQNAILGGVGLVGHCAANAFLDAYVNYYTGKFNTFSVAIDWDRWKAVGMAAGVEEGHKELTGEELEGGMSVEEGVEVFDRILRQGWSKQIVVSPVDFMPLVEDSNTFTATVALKELEQRHSSRELHPRPVLKSSYAPASSELERSLTGIWQQLLGIEQIGIHDNFFELGGHSLLATRLISRVRLQNGVEISLKDFFASPTIKDLAEVLTACIVARSDSDKVDQLLDLLEQIDDNEAARLSASDPLVDDR
ncbi:MAG TPA: SDR family NAD(P)-dependent oxidoreductase [Blastocatellia bacterium]|jgi:acyl transferase domain-containing protein|nr:SDR family NAD(P)-dependent oxidoreductase [Blastocatellia bacterium]